MADAVKKSRIVSGSDENLEESLLEEFNLRLKSCMSQDDLNPPPPPPHVYENVELFLNNERQNHYDVPKTPVEAVNEDQAIYEEIEETKTNTNGIPNLTFHDLPEQEPEHHEHKSVKDRMFLSTDDVSCLLFTQTVTSPMLTPSEENIDFLKGFQREHPEKTEESEDAVDKIEFAEAFTEPIYENVESIKESEHVYENVERFECEEKTVTSSREEVVKIEEEIGALQEENSNVTTANHVSSESYQTSTYVETTTFQDSTGGEEKVSVKKKKTKKSRKSDEKENISVCDTNNEQSFYNVNVKSLCRSFSDLTGVGEEKLSDGDKTHSMSEVDLNVLGAVSVKSLKSSFSKFDALQKKNLLHVRSSDSSKAQEKFSGLQVEEANCKSCGKQVFQMEQIKAEKAIWHKNCFRCRECNKQLNVDTYQSHEGTVYCKPHFKALFAPKAVEDDEPPSDKPDLGLEELQTLNVKERFQVFEHHESDAQTKEMLGTVNVKRSPSILSKLARFHAKGMDVGVDDESLNGIPIEESSTEEEQEEDDGIEGEDADLIRAKRVQKEKPFHFTGMNDVKNRWEQGVEQAKDERREERKQEIQTIRSRLFMGKQGKMKEAYQQAVLEAESVRKSAPTTPVVEVCDTKSLKERFERGEVTSVEENREKEQEDMSVFESGISKKSRSIFMELDANASKAPQLSPVSPSKSTSEVIKKTREVLMARQAADEVVKASEHVDDVTVRTADIQERFKFFETYKEPEQKKKEFRITPPREGQVKAPTPEREIERDPNVVRAEEYVEDSVVAKQQHTATKMLNKFRQMEEELQKEPAPQGPKPLKRFTPPPEPPRPESSSGEEESEEEEEEESEEVIEETTVSKVDEDLIEAQKAARAKQLRAKFEKWEAGEIKKEQANGVVNIAEEFTDEQSQVESARSLRAKFESMRETSTGQVRRTTVKVNRFVETSNTAEICRSCGTRVYPLEKISVHGRIYHKNCFKCMECSTVLRMDSYSYNQGLLYCMPHFKRLFISKGNYDTAFGFGQHKEKWNTTVA